MDDATVRAFVRVRRAAAGDAAALVTLSRRTVDRCYRPFLGDATVERWIDGGRVERLIRDGLDDCVVLDQQGETRGLALCEGNLIRLLMVDPDWQRQGLGSRLLDAVESRLFSRQARPPAASTQATAASNASWETSKAMWV